MDQTDIKLYDPITQREFGGLRTWYESGKDFINWDRSPVNGKPFYGVKDKYWVHGITLTGEETTSYKFPFSTGQPIFMFCYGDVVAGIINSIALESSSDDLKTCSYTLTLYKIEMLEFITLLNEIDTQK